MAANYNTSLPNDFYKYQEMKRRFQAVKLSHEPYVKKPGWCRRLFFLNIPKSMGERPRCIFRDNIKLPKINFENEKLFLQSGCFSSTLNTVADKPMPKSATLQAIVEAGGKKLDSLADAHESFMEKLWEEHLLGLYEHKNPLYSIDWDKMPKGNDTIKFQKINHEDFYVKPEQLYAEPSIGS
jgi:hypothetical protein